MTKLIKIATYIVAVSTIGLMSIIISAILWDKKYQDIGHKMDEVFWGKK